MDFLKELFLLQDREYGDFHSRLMPNISREKIIGVRTPDLRKLSGKLLKGDITAFLDTLPHNYYEENNLHSMFIEQIKDYDECIKRLNEFLPYVDNWATCDLMKPKVFKKNKNRLIEDIKIWLNSQHTYTIRFGIGMLMTHFLDENFKEEYSHLVGKIRSQEYYVNMMIAWYFATMLAKKYDIALFYLEKNKLPVWVHNKTIQKAIESNRITTDKKEYLKTLKIKK